VRSRFVAILSAVIVVLVVMLAYLLGRNSTVPPSPVQESTVTPIKRSGPQLRVAPSPKPISPVTIPSSAHKVEKLESWAGSYSGKVENADGSMKITSRRGGRYYVDINIRSPRCVGGIAFTAKPNGNLIRHREPYDDESQLQCSLTLVRNGETIVTDEHECGTSHGFECSFTGEMRKN